MNFKIILQLLLFIIFIGCKQLETTQKKTIKTEPDTSTAETTLKSSDEDEEDSSKYIFDREYTNQGFALIYDENLFNKKSISKKLDNRGLFIFHTKIRKNSFVKITNPENTKTVIAQVISNKAIFSNFYNSVITKRIVDELLLDENCTVSIAHSRTRDLPDLCRNADIVVAAVGIAEMVRGDWVKTGACVIDVGINRVPAPEKGLDNAGQIKTKLVGDVAFDEAAEVAGHITPVPGGVGPMTIACLLRNTLTAACRQAGIDEAT